MKTQELATDIVKHLVRHGYTAYFAGGWVRDYLMGHPSSDIDIATDAPPEVILDLFPRTILVGLQFGVVIVVWHGHQFEVSTFRRDIDYIKGRKPEKIELADPKEDALRRDFTINGLFYDPLENEIHDFVDGAEDISKGVIRTIGDPFERFYEDRLRMIRAVRFAARFEFAIDLKTEEAIRENAQDLFPPVSMERIWQEFCKMAAHSHFDRAIIDLHRLELLPVIFPQLKGVSLTTIKQRVAPFPLFPPETPTCLYLHELFVDQTEEELVDILRYLKTSRQDQKEIAFARHVRQTLFSSSPHMIEPHKWVAFYAHPLSSLLLAVETASIPPERRESFLQFHLTQQQKWHAAIERKKERTPLVTSAHLITEGIKPGKLMGDLLDRAEEIAIDEQLHTSRQVIQQLKESPLWPSPA
ncbi:MAG: CCA tRNA nucleotidyltransferase [Chlamydiia bacterium]|nr:CCA tRNA nucleotidyltransferase [Chlamydiia bacterium]